MQNSKKNVFIVLLFTSLSTYAQGPDEIIKYINIYKDVAILEMQRTGVPASITLAQGIHESGSGKGMLAQNSNNHFGIKCKDEWKGEFIRHDDDARKECFRKYNSVVDSYKDHSDFLKKSPRYASLFSLDPVDYKSWAYGLKKAGYATNPKYAEILIKLIGDYQLQQYTMLALEKSSVAPSTEMAVIEKEKNEKPKQKDYPEGIFKINETRVIYARKGTSYLAIAQLYSIDLFRIFEFNELTETELVSHDQLIYIQRKRKTGNNEFHIVQSGETLHDIAQEEAIRFESLLELNWLNQNMQPAVGEQLSLRTRSATMPKLLSQNNLSISNGSNNQNSN